MHRSFSHLEPLKQDIIHANSKHDNSAKQQMIAMRFLTRTKKRVKARKVAALWQQAVATQIKATAEQREAERQKMLAQRKNSAERIHSSWCLSQDRDKVGVLQAVKRIMGDEAAVVFVESHHAAMHSDFNASARSHRDIADKSKPLSPEEKLQAEFEGVQTRITGVLGKNKRELKETWEVLTNEINFNHDSDDDGNE